MDLLVGTLLGLSCTTTNDAPTPGEIETAADSDPADPITILSVYTGSFTTCAFLSPGGASRCWGRQPDAELSELGPGFSTADFFVGGSLIAHGLDGTTRSSLDGGTSWTSGPAASAIAAGRDFTCSVVDGWVDCQLGMDESYHQVPAGLAGHPADRIAAGASLCAISHGELSCSRPPGRPLDPIPDGQFQAISVGNPAICALDQDGHAHCWDCTEPYTQQCSPPDVVFQSVDVYHVACGLDEAGAVHCWGDQDVDGFRELLTPPRGQFQGLSVSGTHACAWTSDQVVCWGDNGEGATDVPADLLDP
jgi:hypothetical protein